MPTNGRLRGSLQRGDGLRGVQCEVQFVQEKKTVCRLPEALLLGMRDQTTGQGVYLRELWNTIEEATCEESDQADALQGFTTVSCGKEGLYQGMCCSRVYPSFDRPENLPNVSTANDEMHEDEQAQAPARSEDVEMAEEASESSHSSPIISVPLSDSESPEEGPTKSSSNDTRVEIQEISETDSSPVEPNNAAEPLITEHEEISEASNEEKKSDMVTEIPMWSDKVQLSDIKEASELEYLNVKQLKNLLSTNRVDYKGCLERQELLNRVSRLWQEYTQSRQDVEKLSEEELCKICWDAPIECVILECGHMACCINCGKQMSECPICKQYVVRVVRFFKA
ncbi:E3 ubiquitin-protein ligase RNF34 isoform X4 [Nylanderia fulva]|uniref:E3 ubiquitin-protein ligase RNF34 isoform X4 n=1 Tax=Nylanderia fulva TaxID=613905 RepID=UPI0010FBAEA6|nr:E3 ubiquitin-protein ligase RNF34 isoform X4 [Nylanderia fulva]